MGSSNNYCILLICAILAVHVVVSTSSTAAVNFIPMESGCRGSIAECLMGEDEDFGMEFAMDTEINRRILATNKYISYGALRRNTVPCSRRGASYYNCRPGAQANPYSRGCNRITRCRSWFIFPNILPIRFQKFFFFFFIYINILPYLLYLGVYNYNYYKWLLCVNCACTHVFKVGVWNKHRSWKKVIIFYCCYFISLNSMIISSPPTTSPLWNIWL